MDIFEFEDYKEIIRSQIKEKKIKQSSFSLRKLAYLLPVQYTYLSKVLNDSSIHFNDDQLFTMAQIFEFNPIEIDYLFTLKQIQSTNNKERKNYLLGKMENMQRERKIHVETTKLNSSKIDSEIRYLLEPLSGIVYLALHLRSYKLNPKLLISILHISEKRLLDILSNLEENNFIKRSSENPFKIKHINEAKFHLGKDHPLMRIHQYQIKSLIPSKISNLSEDDKMSFIASFNLDHRDFEKIKNEFQIFLNKIQKIVSNTTESGVYQINFDFFKWL